MGSYGGGASVTDLLGSSAEILSLLLIVSAFVILTFLFLKVRTTRSFQFEIFLFSLVLLLAEVPRILQTLHIMLFASQTEELGLGIHTVSMVVLTGFVAYRVYGYFKKEGAGT